ncbi:MAG: excinuclease ABC subunit UvrC [Patescibacteria group bacterium]|nr:excinuclease ABC subunit UvrC [Patescibacteria group bacterium]
MNLGNIKKLNIPASPGCYQFFDKSGKIIYIGKAANLKSRVLSYWQKSASLTPAKEVMILEVEKIKWVITESEIEALLLEANLIKKHQPKFNVVLRDDKRFTYIKISTEEEWPRVFATRKLEKSGRYFGPFTSSQAVRETLKIIRKIWPFRSCSWLPKKTCLYFRIGKCPGVCESRIAKKDYKDIIRQIILFLEGRRSKIILNFQFSILNYERKIKKRNISNEERDELRERVDFLKYQLINIKKVLAGANIISLGEKYAADVIELAKVLELPKVPERIEVYDISNIFGREALGSMVVFSGGEPDKGQYRKFKIRINPDLANDIGMLKEVLERRFKHTSPPAPLLDRRGEPTPSTPFIKGGKIPQPPFTKGGKSLNVIPPTPFIKGGEWPLPDLVIMDGGKAQLNVALRILKKFGLNISALAVSKGDGLRSAQALDKIFFAGQNWPLELPLASPALHIIKRVRDEAHRFAISYHRKLRKKARFF